MKITRFSLGRSVMVFTTAILMSFTAWGQNDSDNPVKNPSFELPKLESWEWFVAGSAQAEGRLDDTVTHGGTFSFRMSNKTEAAPNVYGQLRQYVQGLEPNTAYHLSVWIKGENVSGAAIALSPGWKTYKQLPIGSFDWKELIISFTTTDAVDKFDLVFIIGSVTDALWVDDIVISKVSDGKKGARYYPSSVREGVPQLARFYPILRDTSITDSIPTVSIRSQTAPTFGAAFQATADSKSFFFQ